MLFALVSARYGLKDAVTALLKQACEANSGRECGNLLSNCGEKMEIAVLPTCAANSGAFLRYSDAIVRCTTKSIAICQSVLRWSKTIRH